AERAVAALGVADGDPPRAGVGVGEVAGGADDVDDGVPLARLRQVRVDLTHGPLADVVGHGPAPLHAPARRLVGRAAEGALLGHAGGAVGGGQHRPAAVGPVARRVGDDAGDGSIAVLGVLRVVHDAHGDPAVGLAH